MLRLLKRENPLNLIRIMPAKESGVSWSVFSLSGRRFRTGAAIVVFRAQTPSTDRRRT